MEEEIDLQEIQPLILDDFAQQQLAYASRWTKFLGIFGMVICCLLLLAGFVFFLMPAPDNSAAYTALRYRQYRRPGFAGLGFGFVGFLYLVIAVVHFFPSLYLLQFAEKIKKGLLSRDQDTLNGAFQKLKTFFRYSGIVVIVVASFYLLILLFAIIKLAFH